jgi:hypothetical protein
MMPTDMAYKNIVILTVNVMAKPSRFLPRER